MELLEEAREEFNYWLTPDRQELLRKICYELVFDSDQNILSEEICEQANEDMFWWDYGADKFVFSIPTVEQWVFKIPFLKKEYNGKAYNHKDECCQEAKNYTRAKLKRLDCFFAETYFFEHLAPCEVDRSPVYIARNVDEYNCVPRVFRHSQKIRDHSSKLCKKYITSGTYQFYGEFPICHLLEVGISDKKIDNLLSFLAKYKINDLHSGNYNLTDDGLVIWDYSGYHSGL